MLQSPKLKFSKQLNYKTFIKGESPAEIVDKKEKKIHVFFTEQDKMKYKNTKMIKKKSPRK